MLFSFGRDPIAVGHEKNIGLIISIFRFIHRIPILAKSQVCTKCLILIFGTLNQFNSTNGFCIVFFYKIRRCASRDSTNALFVKWFLRLERAVFRGICDEIFALFQACVGNFDTIPPWKVVGTLYLASSCVTFKDFALLSVCDEFELLAVMCKPPSDDLTVIFAVLLGFIPGYW